MCAFVPALPCPGDNIDYGTFPVIVVCCRSRVTKFSSTHCYGHLTSRACVLKVPTLCLVQTNMAPSPRKEGRNDSLETLTRVQTPLPAVYYVYIVPRTGLAQTCKRTETLQKPP